LRPRDEDEERLLADFEREADDFDFAVRLAPLRPDFAAARVVPLRVDFVPVERPVLLVVRPVVRLFVVRPVELRAVELRLDVPVFRRLAALALPPLRPAAARLAEVPPADFERVDVLRPVLERLAAARPRVPVAFLRPPVERDVLERDDEERDFDFAPTRSGLPLRLVEAILSSSSSDMESAMLREAPLNLDFGVLPRLAESAAPAAFCWAPDLAGILKPPTRGMIAIKRKHLPRARVPEWGGHPETSLPGARERTKIRS
jgi:hypothetical protein